MTENFKRILKHEGISVKQFCLKIGIGYGSFRTLISGKTIPRWVKAFNFGYLTGIMSKKVNKIEVVDPQILDYCEKCGMDTFLVVQMGCRDENCPEIDKL